MLKTDARRAEAYRFSRFVLTSGTSAVVNLAVRFLLSKVVVFELAVAGAYIVSTTLAYLLARRFVFDRGARSWRSEFGRFAVVNVIGFIQVLLLSTLLLRVVLPALALHWHAEEIAHVLSLGSLAVTSYTLHRLFSFERAAPGGADVSRSST